MLYDQNQLLFIAIVVFLDLVYKKNIIIKTN